MAPSRCCRSRVRSSTVPQAQQVVRQAEDVRPLTSLLVPAVAAFLLGKVIDGKGLLLATYWAARYFVPAGLSLWMAKQAHKHWDLVSAVVVMAASYAASMAVSYRFLAGSTSTIKLQYPLFSGYVTIPRVVAKWIRHHNSLAKFLTKTLACGPWVLLSLAAALQVAVWLDATGRHSKVSSTEASVQASEDTSSQHTPAAQVVSVSASDTSSLAPTSTKAESTVVKHDQTADDEAIQKVQQSSDDISPAQAGDIKATEDKDASQIGRIDTVEDLMEWYSKVTREDPDEIRKAEQILRDRYKPPGSDLAAAMQVATTRLLLERHRDLLEGNVGQDTVKHLQGLWEKAGDKESTGNSRLEEERKEKEQKEEDDEVSNKVRSLNALYESLWGSSDEVEDSDKELWGSSDDEEDSDEDLWGSSDEEEDSDEEVEDSDEEAEDSDSSEAEDDSELEADDSDEEAKERRRSKEQESNQVIGGSGDFANLKVQDFAQLLNLVPLLENVTHQSGLEAKLLADVPESMHAMVEAAHSRAGHSTDLHLAIAQVLAENEEKQLSVRQLRHEHGQLQKELQEAIGKKAELAAELAELAAKKEEEVGQLGAKIEQLKLRHAEEMEETEDTEGSYKEQLQKQRSLVDIAEELARQLQAQLSSQAHTHQLAREALAIEEKCSRDKLQAQLAEKEEQVKELGRRVEKLQQEHAREMESDRMTHERELKAMQEKDDQKSAELDRWRRWRLPQRNGGMTSGGAQAGTGSATTERQPDKPASTPVRISDGFSDAQDGSVVVETAVEIATTASVKGAAAAPVVVQVKDGGPHVSDGAIRVHTAGAAPIQKPVKPTVSAVEITGGDKAVADGIIKVDVAAGKAAKVVGAHKPMSKSDAGRARSDTKVTPEPYQVGSQPSRVSNWLVGDANQEGSKVAADTASATVSSNSKAVVNGVSSDEADDHSVEVIVDASLLG